MRAAGCAAMGAGVTKARARPYAQGNKASGPFRDRDRFVTAQKENSSNAAEGTFSHYPADAPQEDRPNARSDPFARKLENPLADALGLPGNDHSPHNAASTNGGGNALADALGLPPPPPATAGKLDIQSPMKKRVPYGPYLPSDFVHPRSPSDEIGFDDIQYQISEIGGYQRSNSGKLEQAAASSRVSGIGALVERYRGHLVIRHMLEGGPAAACPEIQVGACILYIDGFSTKDMPFSQVLTLLRGTAGSTVTLSLSQNPVSADSRLNAVSADSSLANGSGAANSLGGLVTVTITRDVCAPVSELEPLPGINPLDFVPAKGLKSRGQSVRQ